VTTAHPANAHRAPYGATLYRIQRQTVKPALLVLALAVLMSVVLPSINSDSPYRHALHRSDIAGLADGITLVPTAGWISAPAR